MAIDVSGSVFDMTSAFLSEVQAIAATSEVEAVDLIAFDTEIRCQHLITDETNVSSLLSQVEGGGGTDFRPVFAAMESDAAAVLIVLTDGYGPVPKYAPDHPVLWALTETGRYPVDWGSRLSIG